MCIFFLLQVINLEPNFFNVRYFKSMTRMNLLMNKVSLAAKTIKLIKTSQKTEPYNKHLTSNFAKTTAYYVLKSISITH